MSKTQTIETFADLATPESRIEELIRRNWWSSVPLTSFPASWLLNGEQRLDGRFYANDVFAAQIVLRKSGYERKPLFQLENDIYYPNRFKRVYATAKDAGTPFLTPSATFHFRPTSDKLLAKTCPQYEECFVNEGVLLITRSGTIGRITIVTEYLSKFAISDDLIRIEPNAIPAGYLYAYLSSWIGQALISKDRYGGAIKHLEPHHIGGISIPLLDDASQDDIHNSIMKAFQLRDEANERLDEAHKLLHESLGLPEFDEDLATYFEISRSTDDYIPPPQSYLINASSLTGRLDGSYHHPVISTAIELLKSANADIETVGNLSDNIFIPNRFRRVYVDEAYGRPFLLPSEIVHNKMYSPKYLSEKMNEDDIKQCVLRTGQTIITRSGSVGRVAYIPRQMDRWVGSDDFIRVETNAEKLNPGYLVAFLMTPYGKYQLLREVYGSVVDHIEEHHVASVLIPCPSSMDTQEEIGQKVIDAYEKKELANEIEAKAIRRLEMILEGKESEAR